jgi:ethanolamine transporter EutH
MQTASDPSPSARSLDAQYAQFVNNRFLAMPIAGTLAWCLVGIGGCFLETGPAALLLFGATGSIFYLALGIARLTGEDLLGKQRKGNFFDKLFLSCIFMAWLVFAIAIPFFLMEPSSLPLSVGILAGLMWLPFSVLIRHWVGHFHAISRTVLILICWFWLPEHRFVSIPVVIVATYAITLWVLARRTLPGDAAPDAIS